MTLALTRIHRAHPTMPASLQRTASGRAELYRLPTTARWLVQLVGYAFRATLPPHAREESTRACREGIEPIQCPHLRS
jgi:hypothetical protein